jgi:hypothetical protein
MTSTVDFFGPKWTHIRYGTTTRADPVDSYLRQ